MSVNTAFAPAFGTGLTLTAVAASANLALTNGATSGPMQIRIINTGAAIGYVRTYSSLAAADKASAGVALMTNDLPVASGMVTTFSRDLTHDRIAFISTTGTTFAIIQGDGL